MLKPEHLTDEEYMLASGCTRGEDISDQLDWIADELNEKGFDLSEKLKQQPDNVALKTRHAENEALFEKTQNVQGLYVAADMIALQLIRKLGRDTGEYVTFSPDVMDEISSDRKSSSAEQAPQYTDEKGIYQQAAKLDEDFEDAVFEAFKAAAHGDAAKAVEIAQSRVTVD